VKAGALCEEISSVLRNGVVVEFSRDQNWLGFWNRYFLGSEKGGGDCIPFWNSHDVCPSLAGEGGQVSATSYQHSVGPPEGLGFSTSALGKVC
jgi:hypothetical protein